MAIELIQYKPNALDRAPHKDLPGIPEFRYFGKLFSQGLVPLDRTGGMRIPVRMKNLFPIPALRPMKSTFEELCDARASELLALADARDVSMRVFWSGGIDSTCLLVSLLKNASADQKKRIIVMMTEESIAEYPAFYREHVRGKLKTESAMSYPYLLGSDSLMINGEQNDQLFGFASVGRFFVKFDSKILHQRPNRDILFEFFNEAGGNAVLTNKYLDIFEALVSRAPVEIRSHFEYLWWLNFSLKWQNAYMRMFSLASSRTVDKITPQYVAESYVSFYGTEEFQLWSMLNQDKKIRDEWRSYKWICKDIIFDFTKDADYRDNKLKRGSLRHVIVQQQSFDFIDSEFRFYRDLDPKEYYVPENDFV